MSGMKGEGQKGRKEGEGDRDRARFHGKSGFEGERRERWKGKAREKRGRIREEVQFGEEYVE